MMLRKINPNPAVMRSVADVMNDFLRNDISRFVGNDNAATIPAVNVAETEEAFTMQFAAPGYDKSDFNMNIEEEVLTIEVNKENAKPSENFTRREFIYGNFKRTFTLPETVDIDKISASYNNGILELTLPKKEEAKAKPARKIEVA